MTENHFELEDEELEGLESQETYSSDPVNQEIHEFELSEGVRLDVGATEAIGKTRSYVQTLISEGLVEVNGEVKKANYKIRQGDKVKVVIPPPKELSVEAENIPLDIVYEDEDVLVVNKAQGMVVHPAPGSWTGTLVNALLYHCLNLSGINGVLRPGIVHRIDKDTSGLLVVAKNDQAHQGLAAQVKEHSMARKYIAIVHGVVLESTGTVDAPIGRDTLDRKKMAVTFHNSKEAVTNYHVLERFHDFTYLRAKLETGRTHQIRVHMAYLKHPVLGDPLYGPKRNPFGLEGQMLHAEHLGFVHPRSGEWLEFTVKPPEVFISILEQIRKEE
ncbi:RluA family pseudouridine synthase [Desulfitobacterium metallireducens]|uniref:Pseudouridine synthase n=1 Tax=Desulfitobacterium metallireducens DSM 15288 TaxID=871968 RepID=W0EF58_9FIRM|nr:RluA family pseudouridine synthase [Desulfitobacterium metallireducens]AHF07681.1 pseudouridine synthase [Desulfitobacterium metallireducens DSM 15288]